MAHSTHGALNSEASQYQPFVKVPKSRKQIIYENKYTE